MARGWQMTGHTRTSPVENYRHNRKLSLRQMKLSEAGGIVLPFDEQGFVLDQRLLGAYRMGRGADTAACGCGWVACYNALRLLGRPLPPASVIKALEHDFVFGGRMGTRTAAIPLFFMQRGFRVEAHATLAAAQRDAQGAAANIIYYLRGRHPSAHFVAFTGKVGEAADGQPLYRFYNSLSVPVLPCRAPAGETGSFFCAGGTAGDLRTLPGLLAPEYPVFKLVFSIYRQ